jgi:HSP20 family protein
MRVLESGQMARIYLERQDLPADLQRLFDALTAGGEISMHAAAAECSPPLDVVETDDALEVIVDLPAVPAPAVQIVFARNVLLIAGQKTPPACDHHRDAAFHLAERGFGRFARAVRLEGAFDAGRAAATLAAGELHVTLPRLEDRRGREIRIPIRA